jgi:hypothetical protein
MLLYTRDHLLNQYDLVGVPGSNLMAGRLSEVKDVVFYDLVRGGKGVQHIPLGNFNVNYLSRLDITHTYAVLPLMPKYDCELVELAYERNWYLRTVNAPHTAISTILCRGEKNGENDYRGASRNCQRCSTLV